VQVIKKITRRKSRAAAAAEVAAPAKDLAQLSVVIGDQKPKRTKTNTRYW
jgi:hypothetical protein